MAAAPQLDPELLAWVRAATGAAEVRVLAQVQELWSGYGAILRLQLEGGAGPTRRILKQVQPPGAAAHPRGWATDRSHARKLRSYAVESCFYRDFGARCGAAARVPALVAAAELSGRRLLLLEDLDAAGFDARSLRPNAGQVQACLRWLAEFHARFVGVAPAGLWPVGCYWHLDTRPDELEAIADPRLRAAAAELDARLRRARYQTLVHGDAKAANFCFGAEGVAAVDFQYVGGGPGIKDLAYFLSSILEPERSEAQAPALLDAYLEALRAALGRWQPGLDAAAVCAEWRALYPIAVADFFRFLAGWAPDHWKIHGYSRSVTAQALELLD